MFIARLDADDISYPARLNRQVSFLAERDDVGMVGSAYDVIDETGKVIGQSAAQPVTPEEAYVGLVFRNFVAHSSVMFRADAVASLQGYSTEMSHAEDWDLWWRLSRVTRVYVLEDRLVAWRDTTRSVQKRNTEAQKETMKRLVTRNLEAIGWRGEDIRDLLFLNRAICSDEIARPLNALKAVVALHQTIESNCPDFLDNAALRRANRRRLEEHLRMIVHYSSWPRIPELLPAVRYYGVLIPVVWTKLAGSIRDSIVHCRDKQAYG